MNSGLKTVLTIFAPALVAIILRIILVVLCLAISILNSFIRIIDEETLKTVGNILVEFNMFSWDESWLYWVLVIIGSFLAEIIIWGGEWNED